MNGPSHPPVDLFHGPLSPQVAYVYARVASLPGGRDWTLSGTLHGPHCRDVRTLPASLPFVDLGPGPTLLARATLPDPCFWSPDLPATYRVHVKLKGRDHETEVANEVFGLRNLGTHRRNLHWMGQRFVLRGVHRSHVLEAPWLDWRERAAAMVVAQPSDDLCLAASESGVLLVAEVDVAQDDVASTLQRLARWPAVGIVILAVPAGDARPWHHIAPNLLLACRLAAWDEPIAEWVHLAVVDAAMIARGAVSAQSTIHVPVMVSRPVTGIHTLVDARLACDELQRDVVHITDFAGYIV